MRTVKPRENGLTIVMDKGLPIREVEDVLYISGDHIDYVKFGWGTALVTGHLTEKIAVYQNARIPVFFGGTLFEYYVIRNELDEYRKLLTKYKMEIIEISNGTVEIPHKEKRNYIKEFSKDYTVISEVGSKDEHSSIPGKKWLEYMGSELECGSKYVIAEARESGKGGICTGSGELRCSLVFDIIEAVPGDRIIFEAPRRDMQIWLIKKIGENVNLANIAANDVIPLETLRLGLRSDTMLHFHQKPSPLSQPFNT